MSDFGLVHHSYWTRGSGKRLRGNRDAQLVGAYLLTCSSANEAGLYYLPLVTLCHELGMTSEDAMAALKVCAEAKFAFYDSDAELAWVPNASEIRFGSTMKPSDKKRKWIARCVAAVGNHRFARQFMTRYGEAYALSLGQHAPDSGHNVNTLEAPSTSAGSPIHDQRKPPSDLVPVPLSFVSSLPDLDLPPPSGSPREAFADEAMSETRPRPPDPLGASFHAQAYAEGQAGAGAAKFPVPRGPAEIRALDELARLADGDPGEFIRRESRDYRRAQGAAAQYQRGFSPSKCLEWIGNGRPVAVERGKFGQPEPPSEARKPPPLPCPFCRRTGGHEANCDNPLRRRVAS